MTIEEKTWAGTAIAASGVTEDSAAGRAVAAREKVFAMTQAAEDSVLRPEGPGAWSHGLRAALACRVACLNDAKTLADRYGAMMGSDHAAIANPAETGADMGLGPVLSFVDKVAARPRDITSADVTALQDAGVSDADIVRLTELNAFLGYQIRLVAGLSLLTEDAE